MSHPLQAFFGKVPLFSDLTPEELNEILRGIQPITVSRGQILFQEGDAPDAAYVVEGGDLDVYLERTGTRIPIATIGPNSILGEIALLDGQARTASVQARTDCALFRLEKREFDYLRKNLHPAAYKVARRIAMTVCERIRETNREIQSQLSGDIETELLPSKHSPGKPVIESGRIESKKSVLGRLAFWRT